MRGILIEMGERRIAILEIGGQRFVVDQPDYFPEDLFHATKRRRAKRGFELVYGRSPSVEEIDRILNG